MYSHSGEEKEGGRETKEEEGIGGTEGEKLAEEVSGEEVGVEGMLMGVVGGGEAKVGLEEGEELVEDWAVGGDGVEEEEGMLLG